jgi:hypothetical protein
MRKEIPIVGILLLGACSTVADQPGDDEASEWEADGIFVFCSNSEGLNWYWQLVACDGVPDCKEPKKVTKMPSVCIGPQNIDLSFDAANDAVAFDQVYHFPSWDAEIDEVCAAACTEANDENTGSTPVCIPENFTGQHVTTLAWSPEDPPNCYSWIPWADMVSDPEHASDIDWNDGAGSLPLSCSLLGDCHEQFDADVSEWIYWWVAGGFLASIDPETRAAAYSSTAKAVLTLDMDAGSGPGVDDSQLLASHFTSPGSPRSTSAMNGTSGYNFRESSMNRR